MREKRFLHVRSRSPSLWLLDLIFAPLITLVQCQVSKFLRLSCFEKIGGAWRTDRRTDRVQSLMRHPHGGRIIMSQLQHWRWASSQSFHRTVLSARLWLPNDALSQQVVVVVAIMTTGTYRDARSNAALVAHDKLSLHWRCTPDDGRAPKRFRCDSWTYNARRTVHTRTRG